MGVGPAVITIVISVRVLAEPILILEILGNIGRYFFLNGIGGTAATIAGDTIIEGIAVGVGELALLVAA